MIMLQAVGKHFGERPVLKNISLHVTPGSLVMLAGPNGAGKTTLLRIMAGLLRPDEGTVECGVGAEATGFLGHQPCFYPQFTALDNLRFWHRLHRLPGRGKTRDQACLGELERVELGRFANERAGVFSRGMLQRLNLARLFLLRPLLLLLDEPETGLDELGSRLLTQRMVEARDQGAAIVWITHNPPTFAAGANRLVRLEYCQIAYDGLPAACPEPSIRSSSPVVVTC